MVRVRFHGRGGQGMKTASHIVGTAALLDGVVAQDSPVYGAERRGAPMAAFVRLARAPILERGTITAPHLVVVADDTLLDDAGARPLAGLAPSGGLLISTPHGADEVRARTGHTGPLVARDYLALALEQGASGAAVSTALAAAAGALLGLSRSAVDAALEHELSAVGLGAPARDRARVIAGAARQGLVPLVLDGPAVAPGGALVDVAWVPVALGTPSITAPANTPQRRTGSWRVFRPVIDLARCTRCWICFVRCPDGAIDLDAGDLPHVDDAVCKGCLICAEECPTHAITAVREVRTWEPLEARP